MILLLLMLLFTALCFGICAHRVHRNLVLWVALGGMSTIAISVCLNALEFVIFKAVFVIFKAVFGVHRLPFSVDVYVAIHICAFVGLIMALNLRVLTYIVGPPRRPNTCSTCAHFQSTGIFDRFRGLCGRNNLITCSSWHCKDFTLFKAIGSEPGSPPNGGPATPVSNSGVSERLPSVS